MRILPALAILMLGNSVVLAEEPRAMLFPVPAIAVNAGALLAEEIVVERKLYASEIAQQTHYLLRSDVVGKVAKRWLPAGSAIPLHALRSIYILKEGQRVDLTFTAGGLSIRGAGIALQPGSVGDIVRARNADTGIVVQGSVVADGTVAVGGGAQ